MVKLVDTPASGVGDASRGGSSPLLGTKYKSPVTEVTGLFVLWIISTLHVGCGELANRNIRNIRMRYSYLIN